MRIILLLLSYYYFSKPCHGGKSALILVIMIDSLLTTSESSEKWFDAQGKLRIVCSILQTANNHIHGQYNVLLLLLYNI